MSEYVRRVNKLDKPLASRLGRLDIELTERCNNRCIHCYINQAEDDQPLKAREMDTEFIQNLLFQAAELGCLTVRFTGGEPLLREDFVDLYLYARKLGLKVVIFTNARLITPDLAKLLDRVPPGLPLSVSVYGMHERSYDAVTGVQGAFDEFWQGINLLREYNVPFNVKWSILPQNKDEILEYEDFVASLYQTNRKPEYIINFDLRARRDNQAKNSLIRSLRLSPEEIVSVSSREPVRRMKSAREFAAKFMRTPGDCLFKCGAGLGACIDAYGNAQMCLLLRHPDTIYPMDQTLHRKSHPDSKLQPLEYALTKFFPRVRRMRSKNQDYLSRCAVCFLKCFCEQCPAKSWEEHGTLDTPIDYLCQIAHAEATYLGLLFDGEKAWEISSEVWQLRLHKFINNLES